MTELPGDLLYTEEHEWVMVEEDLAVVGITDFAQGALGESRHLAVRVNGASHFFNSGNQSYQALTHILLVPRHLVDVRA